MLSIPRCEATPKYSGTQSSRGPDLTAIGTHNWVIQGRWSLVQSLIIFSSRERVTKLGKLLDNRVNAMSSVNMTGVCEFKMFVWVRLERVFDTNTKNKLHLQAPDGLLMSSLKDNFHETTFGKAVGLCFVPVSSKRKQTARVEPALRTARRTLHHRPPTLPYPTPIQWLKLPWVPRLINL